MLTKSMGKQRWLNRKPLLNFEGNTLVKNEWMRFIPMLYVNFIKFQTEKFTLCLLKQAVS